MEVLSLDRGLVDIGQYPFIYPFPQYLCIFHIDIAVSFCRFSDEHQAS